MFGLAVQEWHFGERALFDQVQGITGEKRLLGEVRVDDGQPGIGSERVKVAEEHALTDQVRRTGTIKMKKSIDSIAKVFVPGRLQ